MLRGTYGYRLTDLGTGALEYPDYTNKPKALLPYIPQPQTEEQRLASEADPLTWEEYLS